MTMSMFFCPQCQWQCQCLLKIIDLSQCQWQCQWFQNHQFNVNSQCQCLQKVNVNGNLNYIAHVWCTGRLRDSKWKKILKDFGECHENSLIESFKMSPHLICLSWGLRSLLWPASGSGLDVIWKLIPQLRHIKWRLILKLWLRPFLSHHLESLRFFFHFKSPCRAVYSLVYAIFV